MLLLLLLMMMMTMTTMMINKCHVSITLKNDSHVDCLGAAGSARSARTSGDAAEHRQRCGRPHLVRQTVPGFKRVYTMKKPAASRQTEEKQTA